MQNTGRHTRHNTQIFNKEIEVFFSKKTFKQAASNCDFFDIFGARSNLSRDTKYIDVSHGSSQSLLVYTRIFLPHPYRPFIAPTFGCSAVWLLTASKNKRKIMKLQKKTLTF